MLMIKSAKALQIKEWATPLPPPPFLLPHLHNIPLPPLEPDPVDTAYDEPRSLFKATNVSFPLSPERNIKLRKGSKWSTGSAK